MAAKHFIWNDAEPPEDCYTEMPYWTATKGITMVTFTPLQGMSAVVKASSTRNRRTQSSTRP